ncbi:MAG: ABC transporter substrate-binding protein [Reyranellaceae bacterium]
MNRRSLLVLSGAASLALPRAAGAQRTPLRFGFLMGGGPCALTTYRIAAIKEGLQANGLQDGRDYVLDVRMAEGRYERLPDLAADLAKAQPAMLLANTIAAVRAAQQAAPSLPVVMTAINDPVGNGLVQGLARPGGRTTGVATQIEDLIPKMLEFQRTIVPAVQVLGILFNPTNPSNPRMVESLRGHAARLGFAVQAVPVRFPEDLPGGLQTLDAARPQAVQLLPDSATFDLADRIAAFAIERRVPFMVAWPDVVDFGGLLGYGPPERRLLRRVGYYVKRILDGANPGDLPVEQPTEIELRLNLRTAAAIGLALPPLLVASASGVVE